MKINNTKTAMLSSIILTGVLSFSTANANTVTQIDIAKKLINDNYNLKSENNNLTKQNLNFRIKNKQLADNLTKTQEDKKDLLQKFTNLKQQLKSIQTQTNKLIEKIVEINNSFQIGKVKTNLNQNVTQNVTIVKPVVKTDLSEQNKNLNNTENTNDTGYKVIKPHLAAIFKSNTGNIRNLPSTKGRVLRKTKKNTFVFVNEVSKDKKWYKIDGENAWIYKKLIILQ